jgi:hypothetical protein
VTPREGLCGPLHDRKLLTFELLALALACPLLVATHLPPAYWPESVGYALLQVGCSAVAGAIALVGVRAYAEQASRRLLLMGLAFLCFGVLDLFHSLAAPGEPTILFGTDENLSLWFWEVSRLLGSVLLLASVLVPSSQALDPASGRRALWWVAATALGLVVVTVLLTACGQSSAWPRASLLWAPEEGLTDLKRNLELLAVGLQGVVAVAYVRLWQRRRQDVLLGFALGMVSLALGGLALVLEHQFYDEVFWIGCAYKLFAYVCFALGVASLLRPSEAATSSTDGV